MFKNIKYTKEFAPPPPPNQGSSAIKSYSISDLVVLRDRNIISEDELRKLSRNYLGLNDDKINKKPPIPPNPKPPKIIKETFMPHKPELNICSKLGFGE